MEPDKVDVEPEKLDVNKPVAESVKSKEPDSASPISNCNATETSANATNEKPVSPSASKEAKQQTTPIKESATLLQVQDMQPENKANKLQIVEPVDEPAAEAPNPKYLQKRRPSKLERKPSQTQLVKPRLSLPATPKPVVCESEPAVNQSTKPNPTTA